MMKTKQVAKSFGALLLALLTGTILLGCGQVTTLPETFMVSFDTNGGSVVDPITVEKGRKIGADIPTTTKDDDSSFVGWFRDDDTFADPWDFAVDIVTADVTLYAKWIKSEPYPTEVALTAVPFSDTLAWIQTGIDDETTFTLTFYLGTLATRQENSVDEDGAPIVLTIEYFEYPEEGIIVAGSHAVSGETAITWTPDAAVQGGVYRISILTDGANETVVDDVRFKGAGTEENPYLLFAGEDLEAIATGAFATEGKTFRVAHDFQAEVAYAEIAGTVFLGTLDGDGRTISVSGNAGMFDAIGPGAVVRNLTVGGTITTASIATVAAYAITNEGTIVDCTSRAAVTSTAGVVGDPDSMLLGGAAGFVGVNAENGLIASSSFIGDSSSNGVVKALVGGAGIASVNYGIIEDCTNRGTIGAYNSVESGSSMSNYSYMGGIAGFNFGTVRRSATTSTGKLLAQRYWNNGSPVDTSNNRVVGGIVGYNAEGGQILESYFNGIRCHGDQFVGGIAGINAGLISDCYTGGRYYATPKARAYVGGRRDVGGIAGALEGSGSVVNCYNAANVYAYDGAPYAIAERATNCVSITYNHDGRSAGTQTYGNVTTDTLVAPQGDGNVMIANTPLTNGDGISYKMPSAYQTVLGNKFVVVSDETILAWQQN